MKKAVINCLIKRVTTQMAEVDEQGAVLIPAQYENVLDLPAPIGGQTVVCEGVNYYHQVPQGESFDGKECLVYIQYDESKFDYSKWSGFLGDPVKQWKRFVMDNPKFRQHWNVKKADALATYDENGVKTPYTGDDADDIEPIYFGMTWDEAKEHPVKN